MEDVIELQNRVTCIGCLESPSMDAVSHYKYAFDTDGTIDV